MKTSIILDENFTVRGKEYEWTLDYAKETDVINPKTNKPQVTTSQWHYPSLKMALIKYTDEALKPSKDIAEVLIRLDEIEDIIKFKNMK